ncbi:dephospho-CoA kinase [Candidatus Pelagibacter ubique]|nr:dephospho-CoA kinase [Candidatus Pelagibacter ubique]
MIKIAVVGDIGSGKSHIAKLFGYPVFNADQEVASIYKKNKNCFKKLKKNLPKYFFSISSKQNTNYKSNRGQ